MSDSGFLPAVQKKLAHSQTVSPRGGNCHARQSLKVRLEGSSQSIETLGILENTKENLSVRSDDLRRSLKTSRALAASE